MASLTPSDIALPFARYAHGVEIPPGHRLVHSSGQLGVAPNDRVPDSSFEQAQICFDNIGKILAAADMTPDEVFHITAYVTDRAHMQPYMQARDLFLQNVPDTSLPTSTLLIVGGFTRPEFSVEVEIWAAGP